MESHPSLEGFMVKAVPQRDPDGWHKQAWFQCFGKKQLLVAGIPTPQSMSWPVCLLDSQGFLGKESKVMPLTAPPRRFAYGRRTGQATYEFGGELFSVAAPWKKHPQQWASIVLGPKRQAFQLDIVSTELVNQENQLWLSAILVLNRTRGPPNSSCGVRKIMINSIS